MDFLGFSLFRSLVVPKNYFQIFSIGFREIICVVTEIYPRNYN